MRLKRFLTALLTLALLTAAAGARAAYYSDSAFTAGSEAVSPQTLEDAVRRRQILLALGSAEQGRLYDTVDSLNILDAVSKALFDLEQNLVLLREAEARGLLPLTGDEEAQAAREARETWLWCLQILHSDNGMAFLPAGDYLVQDNDPEGNAARYLASWGLTEEALAEENRIRLLDQKLMAAVTAGTEDEEERLTAYVDWFLERMEQADIRENGLGVAEVCLALKGE